jgi:hypothetical protein
MVSEFGSCTGRSLIEYPWTLQPGWVFAQLQEYDLLSASLRFSSHLRSDPLYGEFVCHGVVPKCLYVWSSDVMFSYSHRLVLDILNMDIDAVVHPLQG